MGLINYLTTIRFDIGAARELDADLSAAGVTRPLVVSDAGVVNAGLVGRL